MSEIEADPVHVATGTVSKNGFVKPDSMREYGHHKIVWAPFEEKGQLHTTKFNEKTEEHDEGFVQLDGSVKIGSAEWKGDRVVVIVLDKTVDR